MSLANNSISKYSEDEKKGHENMLFKQEFDDYLKVDSLNKKQGHLQGASGIQEKITEIIKTSILTTKGNVSLRDGSFMVLGFDFMVDSDLNVWLIEINTSPSNELSTPVTSKVIEQFQKDQAKLFFDYNALGKEKIPTADIGQFRLIHQEQTKKESIRDRIMAYNKNAKTDDSTAK